MLFTTSITVIHRSERLTCSSSGGGGGGKRMSTAHNDTLRERSSKITSLAGKSNAKQHLAGLLSEHLSLDDEGTSESTTRFQRVVVGRFLNNELMEQQLITLFVTT